MPTSRRDLLRWQFDLTWALFDLHLRELVPDDYRWEPAPLVWTVRPGPDGSWIPDWSDTEPDPIPVPTIAWLTWHIGWWWSVTLDHAEGSPARDRGDVHWPGEEQVPDWLDDLCDRWRTRLDSYTEADLDAPAAFPWGEDADNTIAHTAAWVNAELMKNAAEIGQLRLLRAAR
ncbi:DinB family protein [Nocardia mexicana]|uniref:DinB family protein n=1 Tax=Nocardia mexicana TaxID=279262 RepID=A0A370H914_9NOCA|nr:DinB family protein [Nocardia mexicana]RDI53141.1 DinB family protein [Nocardia mexicana]